MKHKRRAKLLELIEAGLLSSQSQAVVLLREAGIVATQATVSRDLEELGAVRLKSGEEARYAMLETGSEYGLSLAEVMKNFVISKQVSGNIVVLRTPPGHAGVVAAALDREALEGVLGCIAGDDTVFICVDLSKKTKNIFC